MNNNLVSMSHVFYRALRAVFSSKNVRLSLPCLLLAGCVTHAPKSAISHKQEDKWPQKQLADFLSTRCDDIWNLSGRDVESNPLFWLRGIDCAQRLAPAEARAQAAMLVDDTWQDAFKRGIVMADARITPVERRANVTRLDTYVINIPRRCARSISSGGMDKPCNYSCLKSVSATVNCSSRATASLMRFASSRSAARAAGNHHPQARKSDRYRKTALDA